MARLLEHRPTPADFLADWAKERNIFNTRATSLESKRQEYVVESGGGMRIDLCEEPGLDWMENGPEELPDVTEPTPSPVYSSENQRGLGLGGGGAIPVHGESQELPEMETATPVSASDLVGQVGLETGGRGALPAQRESIALPVRR